MDLSQYRYKLSQYNVFYKDGEIQYMWNTYSNALLELDENAQKYIQEYTGVDDNSNEFNILKNNGFVVYEELDEFNRICLYEKQALFAENTHEMSFIISLGMECNYNCGYCFEKNSDQTGVMTSEVALEVANFICQQADSNPNLKKIKISWFGGEPLLYLDTIEIISKKVMDYTRENNIVFSAAVTTNGRFLNAEVLTKLKKFGLENAQIALDGMCELYCKSKRATLEDFDNVIKNIVHAADKIKLSVRLNIPTNDGKEAIRIADFLFSQHGLLGKIDLYFAFICHYSLSKNEANQAYIDFVHNYSLWTDYIIKNYGISEIERVNSKRRRTYCVLINNNYFCIGSGGELYRCQHDFGIASRKIGDVWRGRFYNKTEFEYYATIDSPNKKECAQCKYVPICMGECMSHCIKGYSGFDCTAFQMLQFKAKLLEGGLRNIKFPI